MHVLMWHWNGRMRRGNHHDGSRTRRDYHHFYFDLCDSFDLFDAGSSKRRGRHQDSTVSCALGRGVRVNV